MVRTAATISKIRHSFLIGSAKEVQIIHFGRLPPPQLPIPHPIPPYVYVFLINHSQDSLRNYCSTISSDVLL